MPSAYFIKIKCEEEPKITSHTHSCHPSQVCCPCEVALDYPAAHLLIGHRPGAQIVRHHAPVTACFGYVAECVEDVSQRILTLRASSRQSSRLGTTEDHYPQVASAIEGTYLCPGDTGPPFAKTTHNPEQSSPIDSPLYRIMNMPHHPHA